AAAAGGVEGLGDAQRALGLEARRQGGLGRLHLEVVDGHDLSGPGPEPEVTDLPAAIHVLEEKLAVAVEGEHVARNADTPVDGRLLTRAGLNALEALPPEAVVPVDPVVFVGAAAARAGAGRQ